MSKKKTKTRLEKIEVCTSCLAAGIQDNDCVCTYQRGYETIELEFEICKCCGNMVEDGNPADTEFNTEQLKKLQEKRGW